MITILLNLLLLIFLSKDQNKLIENENISVMYVIDLIEETKKKKTYNIKFILKNKANKPLYYVASYEKSQKKLVQVNLGCFQKMIMR